MTPEYIPPRAALARERADALVSQHQRQQADAEARRQAEQADAAAARTKRILAAAVHELAAAHAEWLVPYLDRVPRLLPNAGHRLTYARLMLDLAEIGYGRLMLVLWPSSADGTPDGWGLPPHELGVEYPLPWEACPPDLGTTLAFATLAEALAHARGPDGSAAPAAAPPEPDPSAEEAGLERAVDALHAELFEVVYDAGDGHVLHRDTPELPAILTGLVDAIDQFHAALAADPSATCGAATAAALVVLEAAVMRAKGGAL